MPCNHSATVDGLTQFVVIDRFTRKMLYKGTSADEAAELSEPGTCYGHGPTVEEAFGMALNIADKCERS